MPHQVAVLVNKNSQASKKAANVFAGLHGVPGINVIYLDLPQAMFSGRFECTPDEFRQYIYDPAARELIDRDLDEKVLAWVYSVDFPIRIVTDPSDRKQMSLMGLTFLHGKVPNLDEVEQGKVYSPLFAGPSKEGGPKLPSRSLAVWNGGLKDRMPLPSMMLGYVGENGNTMETVLQCIENGLRARSVGNTPQILLIPTEDKARSEPREWQFADVRAELAVRGRTAIITTNQKPALDNLLGVMTGREHVSPKEYGSFAPGAMAENLTSWGAEFQKPQTKCTEWLKAGATLTAATVTEPYGNWAKFPHARFYAHYAAGCTALESFYQSVLSPVQILLLGNPLSQIAGLPVEIKPIGLSREITSDLDAAFVVDAKFPVQAQIIYSALLNGKEIKPAEGNSLIELPFDEMGDGYHEIRVIAQAVSPVTPGGFKDVPVFINKKGRSLNITGLQDRAPQQIVFTVEAGGEEEPSEVYLWWNGRELARAPYGEELVFDEREIGEGPARVQAIAVYEDGMEVRSEPKPFAIVFSGDAE
jgi:uncharacterized protein (TIGR03790 family)